VQPGPQRLRLSREEITRHLAAIGDVTSVLATGNPADKAPLYGQLGLSLTYHQAATTVKVEARPLTVMYVKECPRGDLNTETGQISLVRGNHATKVTRAGPARIGIPRGVRYLIRHQVCARLGGSAGFCRTAGRSCRSRWPQALRGARQPGSALAVRVALLC
jgi:hypothetical protein